MKSINEVSFSNNGNRSLLNEQDKTKREMEQVSPELLQSIKSKMKNKVCSVCHGKGLEEGCPECGKVLKKVTPVSEKIKYVPNHIIPKDYKDIEWSLEDYKRSKGIENIPAQYEKLFDSMNKIYKLFSQGKVPNYSYIVCAPSTMSKVIWAYSCMKQAILKGKTVAPLLDTQEFRRFANMSTTTPDYRRFNMDYDKYINADVVFMTVVKDEYYSEAYASILALLDKRSRMSKSTIIISSFTIEQLARTDEFRIFNRSITEGKKNPSCKYPIVIK